MKCDVFKHTTDNWGGPFYNINPAFDTPLLVQVSFFKFDDGVDWCVCVHGSDDGCMERVFDDEKSAWCCFLEVIGLDDVTINALSERGFVSGL